MVILDLKLDNILSFNDFTVNFSYPLKLRTSLINNESLKDIPSFKYKKLNVFIGANATGKTSLMKCIWKTLLFLQKKEANIIYDLVSNKNKEANIEIDLVSCLDQEYTLHRFKIKIPASDNNQGNILISHNQVKLSKLTSYADSYDKKSKILDRFEDKYIDYQDCLKDINCSIGWNLVLPGTEQDFDKINFIDNADNFNEEDYLLILNSVFKTLDPSIINVSKSHDAGNAYLIYLPNQKNPVIIQSGMKLSDIPILSSGTKYGVNITNIIYSIKYHLNGIYLIDEQFSYVNSDVESAIISTMVSLLGDDEQIFFTTHNNDILSLRYPFHSFYFMRKILENGKPKILISCGSEAENKNNVSPKTIVDNDIFGTAPDLNKIFMLGEYN